MTEERSRRASDGRKWCSVHLATVAPQRCDRCGKPFCLACLQHFRRSLLCAHCLAELQRARQLRSLPSRLRRVLPAAVAGLVIIAVMVGAFSRIQQTLGGAASDASLACAGVGLGLEHPDLAAGTPAGHIVTPSPVIRPLHPATLGVVGSTVRPGRLTVELRGTGFRPDELVCLVGGLSGQGRDHQPRRDSAIGPFGVGAGKEGDFVIAVDFGTAPGGYVGSYAVYITATGVAEMRNGVPPARLHAGVDGDTLRLNASI